MVPPVLDEPVHASRVGYRSHLNHREDSPPEPTSTYIPHPHPLGQKSFDHLSIWAYLAITFIMLAVATVFVYLIYTCYHSGKSRQRGDGATWKRIPRMGGDGRAARRDDKVSDVGEKLKLGGIRKGRVVKGFGFGRDRLGQSESETKMIRLSRPTASKTASSTSTINAGSFSLEHNYLTSPPLVYTKEGPVTCIPFHLPPPPPSPTLEYKRRMERQMYRGRSSPVSPSPSTCSTLSLPPITDGHNTPPGESGNNLSTVTELDLNNIQYAPPLNPFMTPPTGRLWNDPKLSPIHGSVITCSPNIDGGLSTPGRSSFTRGASSISPRTLGRHFSKASLSSSTTNKA